MANHTLVVRRSDRNFATDRADMWLDCPDCDLRVQASITPGRQSDDLIASLNDAHQRQVGVGQG